MGIRKNHAKHKLEQGGVVTSITGVLNADLADYLGPLGFDVIWFEGEHGPVDYADIPNLTRACDVWGVNSLVRVNRNTPGVIYRTLDQGAQGIVVPHVNTAAEARAVVEAAKFHPLGRRGMYTGRQSYAVPDYVTRANDETMVVVLIEDIVAVENLDEILQVDHIDAFLVAYSDLGQSMGHLESPPHPDVQATLDRAIRQIVAAGKVAGATVDDENLGRHLDLGVRFLHTAWERWMVSGARAYLERIAAAAGK